MKFSALGYIIKAPFLSSALTFVVHSFNITLFIPRDSVLIPLDQRSVANWRAEWPPCTFFLAYTVFKIKQKQIFSFVQKTQKM